MAHEKHSVWTSFCLHDQRPSGLRAGWSQRPPLAGTLRRRYGRIMSGTRVIVADDDILLREGLASLLERSGLEIVGQAGDGTELLALTREHVPEVVLVDIRMPPSHSTEGLEAARVIREEMPDVGILVLSA